MKLNNILSITQMETSSERFTDVDASMTVLIIII